MQLTDAQDQVVRSIAARAPAGWERIAVDCEVLAEHGGHTVDYVAVAVVRQGGELSDPQIELDPAIERAVVDLYDAVRAGEQRRTIGGFDLTIDADGRYRFDFNYGKPRRLSGEWDEARAERMDNYLAHYRAEKAA